jgi:hypothetical protein
MFGFDLHNQTGYSLQGWMVYVKKSQTCVQKNTRGIQRKVAAVNRLSLFKCYKSSNWSRYRQVVVIRRWSLPDFYGGAIQTKLQS